MRWVLDRRRGWGQQAVIFWWEFWASNCWRSCKSSQGFGRCGFRSPSKSYANNSRPRLSLDQRSESVKKVKESRRTFQTSVSSFCGHLPENCATNVERAARKISLYLPSIQSIQTCFNGTVMSYTRRCLTETSVSKLRIAVQATYAFNFRYVVTLRKHVENVITCASWE